MNEQARLEGLLRQKWWFNHGCSPDTRYLYGDDGEMQCHKCGIDFRREEFARLEKLVDYLRLTTYDRGATIPRELVTRTMENLQHTDKSTLRERAVTEIGRHRKR
jgi:hypothetical protein